MSEANKRQVGGTHYKTGGTEHWDLFGPEYLMGVATKYVSRWRKKEGLQDLEKAVHYCDKLIEWARTYTGADLRFQHMAGRETVRAWCRNLGLDFVESMVIERIMFWRGIEDLELARDGIKYLIENAVIKASTWSEPEDITVPFRPAPENDAVLNQLATPEDGGQHARMNEETDESLWPWFLTSNYVKNQIHSERWALMEPFYRRIGTDGNHVLEPAVMAKNLPRELASCYAWHGDNTWVVRIENCPETARVYFPHFRQELNHMEHCAMEKWQQSLYNEPSGNDFKRVLRNVAWALGA